MHCITSDRSLQVAVSSELNVNAVNESLVWILCRLLFALSMDVLRPPTM